MHLRYWVYRRNLSNNSKSPFNSNEDIKRKAGCCITGFLGVVFFCLALMFLFFPKVDPDRKLFLIFLGLFGIFEILCFIVSCFPLNRNFCNSFDIEEEDENPSRCLLYPEEKANKEITGCHEVANYQACAGYPEVPSYQQFRGYQTGPSYLDIPYCQPMPYGAVGGSAPGPTDFPPLVNFEGVFAHQQIPIYQEDLIEPQLPPYSPLYIYGRTAPQNDKVVC